MTENVKENGTVILQSWISRDQYENMWLLLLLLYHENKCISIGHILIINNDDNTILQSNKSHVVLTILEIVLGMKTYASVKHSTYIHYVFGS